MICKRCGTEVERGRVLCPTCKEPLGAAVALAAAQIASEARDEVATQGSTMQLPALKLGGKPSPQDLHSSDESTEKLSPEEASGRGKPPPSSRPPDRPLRPGELVAGYVIEAVAGRARFGAHYHARESASQRPVSLWVARAESEQHQAAEDLGRRAAEVDHRNIARTVAVVPDGDRLVVVTERIEGESLAAHLARRGHGKGLPLPSAVNVILQLAAALQHTHAHLPHGALGLDSVWVLASGRLKVTGLVLGALGGHTDDDEARAADVRGLCGMLYELLSGSPWSLDAPPVGRLRPEVPVGVDSLLRRGMGPTPPSMRGFYDALTTAAGVRPLAAQAEAPAPARSKAPEPEAEDRWMLVKGHLDYGPYTMEQLRKEVASGKVAPDSLVKKAGTSQRRPLRDFPALAVLLEEVEKKRAADRAQAERHRRERRQRVMRKLRMAAGLLGFAAVSGAVALLLAGRMEVPAAVAQMPRMAVEAPRGAEPQVSVPPTPRSKATGRSSRRRRRRISRRSVRSAAATSGGAVVAATGNGGKGAIPATPPPPAIEVEFGAGNAEARQAAKSAVRGSSGRLRPCFDTEIRRLPYLRGRYTVSFSVAGDGRARQVVVRGRYVSPQLRGCVLRKLATASYPKFRGLPIHVEFPYRISDK